MMMEATQETPVTLVKVPLSELCGKQHLSLAEKFAISYGKLKVTPVVLEPRLLKIKKDLLAKYNLTDSETEVKGTFPSKYAAKVSEGTNQKDATDKKSSSSSTCSTFILHEPKSFFIVSEAEKARHKVPESEWGKKLADALLEKQVPNEVKRKPTKKQRYPSINKLQLRKNDRTFSAFEVNDKQFLLEKGFDLKEEISDGKENVYLAFFRDPTAFYTHRLKRKLACKIIERCGNEMYNKFYYREIDIVKKLKHPNIIELHSVLEFDSKAYIFMTFAEHGDLLSFISKYGALREIHVKIWFKQITEAVKYMHTANIVHRDIKCDNILISNNFILKLADFGLSRYYKEGLNSPGMLDSTFCGSFGYVAPEIIIGLAHNPKLADVWSLGVVLFIMLNGSMPFDDSNILRLVQSQLNKTWAFRSSIYEVVSMPARELVLQCLEPIAENRCDIFDVANATFLSLDEQAEDFNSIEFYSNRLIDLYRHPIYTIKNAPIVYSNINTQFNAVYPDRGKLNDSSKQIVLTRKKSTVSIAKALEDDSVNPNRPVFSDKRTLAKSPVKKSDSIESISFVYNKKSTQTEKHYRKNQTTQITSDEKLVNNVQTREVAVNTESSKMKNEAVQTSPSMTAISLRKLPKKLPSKMENKKTEVKKKLIISNEVTMIPSSIDKVSLDKNASRKTISSVCTSGQPAHVEKKSINAKKNKLTLPTVNVELPKINVNKVVVEKEKFIVKKITKEKDVVTDEAGDHKRVQKSNVGIKTPKVLNQPKTSVKVSDANPKKTTVSSPKQNAKTKKNAQAAQAQKYIANARLSVASHIINLKPRKGKGSDIKNQNVGIKTYKVNKDVFDTGPWISPLQKCVEDNELEEQYKTNRLPDRRDFVFPKGNESNLELKLVKEPDFSQRVESYNIIDIVRDDMFNEKDAQEKSFKSYSNKNTDHPLQFKFDPQLLKPENYSENIKSTDAELFHNPQLKSHSLADNRARDSPIMSPFRSVDVLKNFESCRHVNVATEKPVEVKKIRPILKKRNTVVEINPQKVKNMDFITENDSNKGNLETRKDGLMEFSAKLPSKKKKGGKLLTNTKNRNHEVVDSFKEPKYRKRTILQKPIESSDSKEIYEFKAPEDHTIKVNKPKIKGLACVLGKNNKNVKIIKKNPKPDNSERILENKKIVRFSQIVGYDSAADQAQKKKINVSNAKEGEKKITRPKELQVDLDWSLVPNNTNSVDYKTLLPKKSSKNQWKTNPPKTLPFQELKPPEEDFFTAQKKSCSSFKTDDYVPIGKIQNQYVEGLRALNDCGNLYIDRHNMRTIGGNRVSEKSKILNQAKIYNHKKNTITTGKRKDNSGHRLLLAKSEAIYESCYETYCACLKKCLENGVLLCTSKENQKLRLLEKRVADKRIMTMNRGEARQCRDLSQCLIHGSATVKP